MKKILLLTIFSICLNQEVIGEGLSGNELIDYVVNNYKTSNTLGYNDARNAMYGNVDNNNGTVKGIYSQLSVNNVPECSSSPSQCDYVRTFINNDGTLNCEHVWPQSLYEGSEPMKSDMHHIRPAKQNINSSRGNNPFGEINDSQTNHWYWLEYDLTNPPSQNINQYSESYSTLFEPREDKKGDIARTIFYFYTMYSDVADNNFFDSQKDILYEWHQLDPITSTEITRTFKIAEYQDYPNPFIVDDSLIQRCYFEDDVEEYMIGDVNQDYSINILDVVYLMNYILNLIDLNAEQIILGDLNNDNGINILDIVLLIEEIIS